MQAFDKRLVYTNPQSNWIPTTQCRIAVTTSRQARAYQILPLIVLAHNQTRLSTLRILRLSKNSIIYLPSM